MKILYALHDEGVQIAMISISDRYVLFNNGFICPITAWLDENEMPVDDPDDAVAYEFGSFEMGFGIKSFDKYDIPLSEQ